MADKYSTIQQHQPLRVPEGWSRQEKSLIVQLDEIFDDIYRRYGRLKLSDMSIEFRKEFSDLESGVEGAATKIELTATSNEVKLYAEQYTDGQLTNYSTTSQTASAISTAIGTALGDYYTKTETASQISTSISSALGNYYTKTETASQISTSISTALGSYSTTQQTASAISAAVADCYGKQSGITINSSGISITASKTLEVNSGCTVDIKSGGVFKIQSSNLNVDDTGLEVKRGLLKGDHYTQDGIPILNRNDVIISTVQPSSSDGRIWVKPLDSSVVNYLLNIPDMVAISSFSGTLTTSGAISGLTGSFSYRLKIPIHAGSSTGTGINVSANVGGLTFTQHIDPGSYTSSGYDGERLLDVTVTSSSWLGSNSSLAISVSASGSNLGAFKIKAGSIEFTATHTGSGGSGWKACEIKVYKG